MNGYINLGPILKKIVDDGPPFNGTLPGAFDEAESIFKAEKPLVVSCNLNEFSLRSVACLSKSTALNAYVMYLAVASGTEASLIVYHDDRVQYSVG